MRRIDLHCYPGTREWIASQGPFADALAAYWKRDWVGKDEAEVAAEFRAAGVEAVLVAFDIESLTGAPPCTNDYVAGMRDRNPGAVLQVWGAVDPLKGQAAIEEAERAVREFHVLGFHFHRYFFDRIRFGIAAGLADAHGRRRILAGFDKVVVGQAHVFVLPDPMLGAALN